ncbi:HIT family protein [Kaustia mangrovi]|uniref:HIT family protein n=1 Tax=Kaustia mangrovi TaxID=2593653 RepID=A0A7S8C6F7_9HYPH|nr:HIT family protein [Kaustia mangrovi]QPC44244.1 HIT family protein [Kaustia mangrovi]
MANETMQKFGFPDTLVADYRHWCVLLRPAQATLGALVLVCKDEARAFSEISPDAFAELADATAGIEGALSAFRPYDKINYLMLMMVDPDVHFHVLPRYSAAQDFEGTAFPDSGWPGPPALAKAVEPDEALRGRLVAALRAAWPDAAKMG